jgi:hypothetical protein
MSTTFSPQNPFLRSRVHTQHYLRLSASTDPRIKSPNINQKISQNIPSITAVFPSIVILMLGISLRITIKIPLRLTINEPMPSAIRLCPMNIINIPNRLGDIVRK